MFMFPGNMNGQATFSETQNESDGMYICSSNKSRAGARFSKVPKSFRARKATTKISNLKFTELFFSHIFSMNKFSLHAKFHSYTLLCL